VVKLCFSSSESMRLDYQTIGSQKIKNMKVIF